MPYEVHLTVDPFASFDELYRYWKRAEQVQTPFCAILLSTEIAGLDKRVTDFVLDNVSELNDMSGTSCAVFMATPRRKNRELLYLPSTLETRYKEISYSIGRLLKVSPEQFPSIIFFDNLTHPKQMVVVTLASILGSEPTDEDLVHFFRGLFTMTQNLADNSDGQRLQALQNAIVSKWEEKKATGINFAKVVETTLTITEIGKNVTNVINDVLRSLKGFYGTP